MLQLASCNTHLLQASNVVTVRVIEKGRFPGLRELALPFLAANPLQAVYPLGSITLWKCHLYPAFSLRCSRGVEQRKQGSGLLNSRKAYNSRRLVCRYKEPLNLGTRYTCN